MEQQIKHNYFFAQQPAVVWEYLTKPELMGQWLMKNDFQPIIGCDFQFRTNAIPQMNFDGICYCRVLELVPCKKLSYSWKGGPGDGTITLDSIVVWTLHPKDGGTELQLVHSGFKEAGLIMFTAMNSGWLKNIQKIDALINNANHGTTQS